MISFTLSKDNKLRTEISVKHRVDRDIIVSYLTYYCIANKNEDGSINTTLFNSEKKLIDILKRELLLYGNIGHEYWEEGYEEKEIEESKAYVSSIVNIFFPKIKS